MKTAASLFGVLTTVCGSALLCSCDKQQPSSTSTGSQALNQREASLPAGLFISVQPASAKSLEDVKSTAKTGDSVVVRGRVGGSMAPFVEGRAIFTLMGSGLKACSDNADDKCKTPWDYCCETAVDIAKHSATVQVVDATGAPVKANLKGQNGLKELSELIVVGKVVQANDKVTIIAANEIFNMKP